MESLTAWQQFFLQLAVTLVPVGIAYLKQKGNITALKNRIVALETENGRLNKALEALEADHSDLQKEYKANLKAQAGMRDTF